MRPIYSLHFEQEWPTVPDVSVAGMLDLEALGPRIAVIGRSCAGKSTLAQALGAALGTPVHHLDTLHHQLGKNWVPRSAEDFSGLHDKAISGKSWITDGNYSRLMPERFKRATSVIWLDLPMPICLWRYCMRALPNTHRIGGLAGGSDGISWQMLHIIIVVQSLARSRMAAIVQDSGLSLVHLGTPRQVAIAQTHWALKTTQT